MHQLGEIAFLFDVMRITKRIREEYEQLLKSVGEARFFSHILSNGVLSKKHFDYPENMMMDQSDAFFALYRSTGNYNYFTIGRILRRAAHKIYRRNRQNDPEYKINTRFLDII